LKAKSYEHILRDTGRKPVACSRWP